MRKIQTDSLLIWQKKMQREVQINLPRKVGMIAKNQFTYNFHKGGFVDSSLVP